SSIGSVQAQIEGEVRALSRTAVTAIATDETAQNSEVNFADVFKQAIQSVDDKQRVASEAMAAVDSGKSDDLVGAMLASQEASLSFSMLMQMRNKVANAMDELFKLSL